MKNKRLKEILFFIAITSMLFTIGCAKKCPEVSSNTLSWLPYNIGDSIFLSDGLHYDTLIVESSVIHQTDKIPAFAKCGCHSSYEINLVSTSNDYNIYIFDNDSLWGSNITIDNKGINWDEYYLDYRSYNPILSVDGENFADVITFEQYLVAPGAQMVNILYLAKKIGIVGVKRENVYWKPIYTGQRSIDRTTIETIKHDC